MFPVEAHTIPSAPASRALATATAMPRSLKLPVGFEPSYLTQSSMPSRSERRGAGMSGVFPSPSVTVTSDSTLGDDAECIGAGVNLGQGRDRVERCAHAVRPARCG